MGRHLLRWRILLGVLIVTVAALTGVFLRAHLQAVAVLREVAGQPVPWAAREMTVAVATEDRTLTIATPTGQEQIRARLYLTQGSSSQGSANAPAMVIFHGVHHLGIDEPRLVGFARAMASCGIRVLTPELPGIKDYHVSQDSVEAIGQSVRWFAGQTGGPVGVMGLSFAGGLALVADSEPQYHSTFKFIVAVGSQDSMQRVAKRWRRS